jgi:hypothetical protein
VTPSELVTAIITERGVAQQPLGRTLARLARDTGAPAPPPALAMPPKPARKAEPRKQRRR